MFDCSNKNYSTSEEDQSYWSNGTLESIDEAESSPLPERIPNSKTLQNSWVTIDSNSDAPRVVCNYKRCLTSWLLNHSDRLIREHFKSAHGVKDTTKRFNIHARVPGIADFYTGKPAPEELKSVSSWTPATKDIMVMFCMGNYAYSSINFPGYQRILDNEITNVPSLKEKISQLDLAIFKRLKNIFKRKGAVSLCFDVYKSISSGDLNLAILAVFQRGDFLTPDESTAVDEKIYVILDLVLIENESVQGIKETIESVLVKYGIQEKVISYTCDNLVTNEAVIRELGSTSIPCILHSINLFVNCILTNLVAVDRNQSTKSRYLINKEMIQTEIDLYTKLRTISCKINGYGKYKAVIRAIVGSVPPLPVATRWSSRYRTFEWYSKYIEMLLDSKIPEITNLF
ncbi:hypothetical protein DASC09_014510 [Saccharomycopsis crataegensis]|uniref:Transposase n=1 Tax=Saccharomycopsis crataegensis TaxID=43959 RepID=A0AAV5QHN2_9ASCO|nr:hypothetical protein DASC09_014510 [Saccharomycopsis crataegensis]